MLSETIRTWRCILRLSGRPSDGYESQWKEQFMRSLVMGRFARTATVVVALLFFVTACSEIEVTPTITCAIDADNPHQSSGTPGAILGKARYGCDASIYVDGYVVLQKKNSVGSWYNYTSPYYFNRTVTAGKEYTVYSPSIACQNGTFRTKAYGWGSANGQTASATSYSQTVINPCS
jgi:hypothetical protein